MARVEALLMSSLVLILAIFLRKRRSFVQWMRLMSQQMRRMRQNVVVLAIESQNDIQKNCWLPVMRAGIDSACRRGETSRAMDEGSEN